MYGLKGGAAGSTTATDGLVQAITATTGVARVTSGTPAAPTGYYADLETVDWNYAASGDNRLTQALAAYLAWAKSNLLIEAMNAACWQDGTAAAGAF